MESPPAYELSEKSAYQPQVHSQPQTQPQQSMTIYSQTNPQKTKFPWIIFIVTFSILILIGVGVGVGVGVGLSSKSVEIVVQSANTKEQWIQEMTDKFNEESFKTESGVRIKVKVVHTGSGFKEELKPDVWSPANILWVDEAISSNEFGTLFDSKAQSCFSLTNIPLGFAVWKPLAQALGWPDAKIGFNDIIELTFSPLGLQVLGLNWGPFRLGHGHPEFSNSGRLSIVSSIYAFNNLSQFTSLNEDIIFSTITRDNIRQLARNVPHMGRIDTDLLDKMVEKGPTYLHAVVNYESNVLRWNKDKPNKAFPFVFLYPSDGTYWFDHPYCILNKKTSSVKSEAAKVFYDFLRSKEGTDSMIKYGIRPSGTEVDVSATPNSPFTFENGLDPRVGVSSIPPLPYPTSSMMTKIIQMWYEEKKPAVVFMIIDRSGSMGLDNMNAAKAAAVTFVNKMSSRDYLHVLIFSSGSYYLEPRGKISNVRSQIINQLESLFSSGGTDLYSTILKAGKDIDAIRNADINRENSYSVVVMTDGQDTENKMTYEVLLNQLPNGEDATQTHIYTIGFGGGADMTVLEGIAKRTNGKAFKASATDIAKIYEDISLEF